MWRNGRCSRIRTGLSSRMTVSIRYEAERLVVVQLEVQRLDYLLAYAGVRGPAE